MKKFLITLQVFSEQFLKGIGLNNLNILILATFRNNGL